MEKVIRLNREVLPDFDDLIWKEELKKLGIQIKFLLSDGVEIRYDSDQYDAGLIRPDSIEFYDPKTRSLILSYVENFGNIEFYRDQEEEPIVKIKIIDLE